MDTCELLLALKDREERANICRSIASEFPSCRIDEADSFEDAATLLGKKRYGAVISDLLLEGEALSDLFRKGFGIPFVIVASPDMQHELRKVLELGIVDFVFRDSEGQYIRIMPVIVDKVRRITDAFEHEMRISEKRYENLVQALPDIVYELDASGRFTFVNDAVRMLSYEPKELVGKHFSELLYEHDVPQVSREIVLKNLKGKKLGEGRAPKLFDERRGWDRKTTDLEIRLKKKNKDAGYFLGNEIIGSVISYGEVNAVGQYGKRGGEDKFIGTVGIIGDITVRRKSEEMLRKLYQAVDQSPVAVIISDFEYAIEYVNPQFLKLTGYEPGEVLKRNIEILKSESQPEAQYRNMIETVESGIEWRGEMKCRRKNGEDYWSLVFMSPVREPDGLINHYVSIQQDISELKKNEIELQKARENAELANKAKSEFLANISHEIRTPLSGIIGISEMTLTTGLQEDQRKYIGMIRDSAKSLLMIVNEILDYSKIEARKLELRPIVFNLRELIDKTILPFTVQAHGKGLDVFVSVSPDIAEQLFGDSLRLSQVISNLMGNAIKFTDAGRISVDVRLKDWREDSVVLLFSVSDTGIGIPVDKHDRLFKTFSQIDVSVKKRYPGTGLGLAISKEIVELMNGDIWFESEENKGSTFYFSVTLLQVAPGKITSHDLAASDKTAVLSSIPPIKILLAEDNEMNQTYLLYFLKHAGHDVSLAVDGREAFELFKNNTYDIVLMDIQMPEMDGVEAANSIRAWETALGKERTPIIALTAYAMPGDKERFESQGFDGYIAKPIDMDELFLLMEKSYYREKGNGFLLRHSQHLTRDVQKYIDVELLLSNYKGEYDLLRQIIRIFLQETPNKISHLSCALNTEDTALIATAAHSFINSAGMICAHNARSLARQLELAAKREDFPLIREYGNAFLREIEMVLETARNLLKD